MADIFISYAREDIDKAQQLAEALESQRWTVFWDRTIPAGQTWRSYIGKALQEARCVIVPWSTASIDSDWVQEEADDAKQRGVLVPVLFDAVMPPIGFRAIQAADLVGWDGDTTADSFLRLRDDLTRLLGTAPEVVEAEKRQRAEAEGKRKAEEEERQRPAAKPGAKTRATLPQQRLEQAPRREAEPKPVRTKRAAPAVEVGSSSDVSPGGLRPLAQPRGGLASLAIKNFLAECFAWLAVAWLIVAAIYGAGPSKLSLGEWLSVLVAAIIVYVSASLSFRKLRQPLRQQSLGLARAITVAAVIPGVILLWWYITTR